MKSYEIKRSNTILYCHSWKETVAFYRSFLNLPVTHETGWFVEFKVNELSFLSIADAARTSLSGIHGNGITLSFKVADLEERYRAFRKAGVETSKIIPVWGSRSFYIHDPEGNRIEWWS